MSDKLTARMIELDQEQRQQERERERVRDAAEDMLEMLRNIVMNAQFVSDASMGNMTDCYAVPLGDIEKARAAITKAAGK